MITKDKIRQVNRISTALQLEQNDMERQINLILPVGVMEENQIIAAQWHAVMDKRTCPICEAMNGRIFPVYTSEFTAIAPPIHVDCRCILSYITARERGVFDRLAEYRPIDPELLKTWSSRLYTDEMIRKFTKTFTEFVPTPPPPIPPLKKPEIPPEEIL